MSLGIMAPRKQFDIDLIDTFGGASYLELDYRQEARNQERFKNELIPKIGKDRLHVPDVHWEGTSRKVLCSEFIHGTHPNPNPN